MQGNSINDLMHDCGCNDYSLLTANTQISNITVGNTSLTGSGNVTAILTAGGNGTIVKSVIIKATGPVTRGMIRLFVGTSNASTISLYKEIPISTEPQLANTPTPAPFLTTFEMTLSGGLKLLSGYKLYASTQNSESFNVIVEALDWAYPAALPDSCCNYKQDTAATGLGTISTANTNLNGSGAIVAIFTAPTAPSNGTLIKTITIKALQSTNLGMIRLFISPNATTYSLMKEISIPESVQSGFDPSFKIVLEENFCLQAGYTIGAATQIGQSFAITVEGIDWNYPI